MSLKKLIEISNSGIEAEHWYLAETKHNHLMKVVVLRYIGFKSKQDRLDGKSPIPNAKIDYTARNYTESEFDDGNETIVNHNEYGKYVTPELKTLLRQQARKHVRIVARNTILSDAVDD